MRTDLNTPLLQRIASVEQAQRELKNEKDAIIEEAKVYVGLNDMVTRAQKLETERYVSILKNICREFGVPFSLAVVQGGYMHDDGEYTEEKSIVLTFIDLSQDIVDAIAKELCVLFHQESVLVTVDRVRMHTVREHL